MLSPLSSVIEPISVVIGRPDPKKNYQHIGFLYFNDENRPKFLHLQWHETLRNDPPHPHYQVLDIDLEPFEKVHLAAYCALVHDKNGKTMPYNLAMDDSYFDTRGEFHPQKHYSGLTCATFVLKIFSAQGYHLIDPTTWKTARQDKKWQLGMVEYLKEHTTISKAYLEELTILIKYGLTRFKPEEVAASIALIESCPNTQKTIAPLAKKILKEVISYAKKLT